MKSPSDDDAKKPKVVATASPSPSEKNSEDNSEPPPVEVETPSLDNAKNYTLSTLTGKTELIYSQGLIGDTKNYNESTVKKGITLAGEVYMDIIDDPVFNSTDRETVDEVEHLKQILDERAMPVVYGDAKYYLSYGTPLDQSIAPMVPKDGKVVVNNATYNYAATPIQTSFTVPEVEAQSDAIHVRGYLKRIVGVYDAQNHFRIMSIKGKYGIQLVDRDGQGLKVNGIAYQEESKTIQ